MVLKSRKLDHLIEKENEVEERLKQNAVKNTESAIRVIKKDHNDAKNAL